MVGLTAKRVGAFLAQAGTAAGLIAIMNWVFNYPFTILVVLYLDFFIGVVVWTVTGLAVNLACVVWYKRTTRDWFGLEYLRMQQEVQADTIWGEAIRWALRNSKFLAFGLISLFLDPIYGFLYHRGRVSGKSFDLADWYWFALANIIGMLPWILGGYGGLEVFVLVGDTIKGAAE